MRLSQRAALLSPLSLSLGLALGLGCGGGTTTTSQSSGQSPAGSSGRSSAASSGGTSAGSSTGAASTGTSTGSSTGSSTNGASTTTGTGAAGRPPDFVDGGYVFCSAQVDTDAGVEAVDWMCQPGTYFCESPGNCAQCRSDADCTNTALPTYEPFHSRCDLDSGVAGYQNHCEHCLGNADCASNPIDNQCDLDLRSVEPGIETTGFETCVAVTLDCPDGTQPGIGGCFNPSCTTDSDCVDAVSIPNLAGSSSQQAEPFCVDGGCASSHDLGLCPNCYCFFDSYCPDPNATCDLLNDHCACTDSSQCGGAWPICQLSDAGDRDDAGALLGSCGCRDDQDCGDAGLRCLYLPANNTIYGGPACVFDCNDPRFPGCANLLASTPLCDVDSGLCGSCETDEECRTQAMGLFVGPFCRDNGICGCQADSDCKDHEVCGGPFSRGGAGSTLGQCIPPPVRCTPASCGGTSFCDLDGGTCEPIDGSRVCASDADCAYVTGGGLCEPDAGACVYCLANADCVASGLAAAGYSRCLAGVCSGICAADADCDGNPVGAHCVVSPLGPASNFCGCAHDADCAGNRFGSRCDVDAGACGCNTSADCAPGESCHASPGYPSECSSVCRADSDCPPAFFCLPSFEECRPRCDDGGSGCQAPDLVCDTNNKEQVNGQGDSGVIWCYQCLTGDDCGPGAGCSGNICQDGACYGPDSCHSGQTCGAVDYQCHASCDAGACPSGQVCDTDGTIGNGSVCYECLSPADCPVGQGCNSLTRKCGTCKGPTAQGGYADCPPDAICSSYWQPSRGFYGAGVCLQNCDVFACANPNDICGVFPQLTPDHKYCFGCLQDSDCADAGAGARCDNSIGLTFTCTLPPAP